MKVDGRVVLVTGGSAGIGLSIARAFLERKSTVIVCGRDAARLERVKQETPGLETRVCDVSRAEDRASLVQWCGDRFPALDVLVNNAGMMQTLDLVTGGVSEEAIRREMEINLTAPILLTLSLLPHLSRQASSAIVNVSSVLGYVPLARAPIYCATKSALHSFTLSLRQQLLGSTVRVFELVPSTVDTDAAQAFDGPKLSPDAVATALLRGLARDTPEIRVGLAGRLYAMSRLMPGVIYRALNKAK